MSLILVDGRCPQCDRIAEYLLERDEIREGQFLAGCERCGKFTALTVCCTGGTSSRWRFCDSAGIDWRERFRVTGASAEYTDPKTGETHAETDIDSGEVIHGKPRWSDPQLRAERREKTDFLYKRRKGRLPLRSLPITRNAYAGGKSAGQ